MGLLLQDKYYVPTLVDTSMINGNIIQIATGKEHTLLLTGIYIILNHLLLLENGNVYATGSNSNGQLGCCNFQQIQSTFHQVSTLNSVKSIYASEFNSYAITTGILKNCEIINIRWKNLFMGFNG